MAEKKQQGMEADTYVPGREFKRRREQALKEQALEQQGPELGYKRPRKSLIRGKERVPNEGKNSSRNHRTIHSPTTHSPAGGPPGRKPGFGPHVTQQQQQPGQQAQQGQEHKIRAWGYEDSEHYEPRNERATGGGFGSEQSLWLLFFVLLVLVLVFSQRSWLVRLFPFGNRQQLHTSIEILRSENGDRRTDLMADAANIGQGGNFGSQSQDVGQDARQNPRQDTKKSIAAAAATKPADPGDRAPGSADETGETGNLLQRFDRLLRIRTKEPDNDQEDNTGGRFRDVRLFFVRVEEDGRLRMKSVLYKIPFDQTPLSRTMEQLLKGPGPQDINKGLHSMLPPEMEVLNIRIVGTTAFLDVSEEFNQVSPLAAVLLAAVKQLVFTVTEYPGVKSLRILVEGQPIFTENLPHTSAKELERRGIRLNSELKREDLWQGEMGEFVSGP
ncbi:GerMN domain-containing protein [Candidatus Haliotispira prima]|uniref:GerMN domain-containing protein n=1 Tax=Candidatus Haliotispira prima TaxID=3034016 RepID=A0ABY8MHE4_9SPIO|nr:GerMN domain-containing protein [Candidatus Haliotispira prima]